jgi:hypothetical protein
MLFVIFFTYQCHQPRASLEAADSKTSTTVVVHIMEFTSQLIVIVAVTKQVDHTEYIQ